MNANIIIKLSLIILWSIVGGINFQTEKITKFDYFCCWTVLMVLLFEGLLRYIAK